MEIKPEEKVEIILWDWLKTKGENIVKIYFNRKNILNCKTFKVIGTKGSKPDLLFSFKDFNKTRFVAIEIKDGDTNRNVFDSNKIFSKYYLDYIKNKAKYYILDKKIKIDFFVVATQYSIFGKLIKEDNRIIDNIDKGQNDKWRSMSAKSKTLPRCEYTRTSDFLRNLWANFREWRNKNECKNFPALGILTSDILKNFHPTELKIQSGMKGKPMLLTMRYIDWMKKPQWMQNYIYI